MVFLLVASMRDFLFFFFFFNDTATTEIYTLSLHDALPISSRDGLSWPAERHPWTTCGSRSEEHTSELQSRQYLVCRLLLEKKKKKTNAHIIKKQKKKKKKNKKNNIRS